MRPRLGFHPIQSLPAQGCLEAQLEETLADRDRLEEDLRRVLEGRRSNAGALAALAIKEEEGNEGEEGEDEGDEADGLESDQQRAS
jgi:hypothetical protein